MAQLPLSREQAIDLLKGQKPSESDLQHYIESEAIMKKLAEHFEEDPEYWGMLGLLHDVDWSLTKDNPAEHLTKTEEILKPLGFDEEFIRIILSHGYGLESIPFLSDKKRTEKIEYALVAAETLSGLIFAYALMRDKQLTGMTVKGLKKKFKDKRFSAGCSRDIIREIENTGLELSEFFQLAIEAMVEIKEELKLK